MVNYQELTVNGVADVSPAKEDSPGPVAEGGAVEGTSKKKKKKKKKKPTEAAEGGAPVISGDQNGGKG